uniref:Uncharacterized protein n=1 Tax=Quercus lobata TaxID=97700 RepID=A0A7N2MWC6_QUELO
MQTFFEYKFYVDGKWGYDESEHHVTSDYGIVNTPHLSTDDMDVDNDAFSACDSFSPRPTLSSLVKAILMLLFYQQDHMHFGLVIFLSFLSIGWSKYRMPWVIDDVEGRYISLQQSFSLVAYLHEEFVII